MLKMNEKEMKIIRIDLNGSDHKFPKLFVLSVQSIGVKALK